MSQKFQGILHLAIALMAMGVGFSNLAHGQTNIPQVVVGDTNAVAEEVAPAKQVADSLEAKPTLPTPDEPAVAIVPPPPEGCRPLTEKAMANDMKAVHAQSQSVDLADQLKLLEEAVTLWSKASMQCEGRAKERAQRNWTDSQKVRDGIKEQLGSGTQCLTAQKDAANLQDLAKKALAERRYSQSSNLFRKAGDNWDVASELCTGDAQKIAETRREQSEVDGHNAENCAPLFEKAREQTLKFRATAGGLTRDEKQEASQVVETLWRDAASRCKGDVVATANGNAQAIARDRGTPWVARVVPTPVASPKTAPTTRTASSTPTEAVTRPMVAPVAAPVTVPVTVPVATNVQPPPALTMAPPIISAALTSAVVLAPQVAPIAQASEFVVEGTRYSGKFVIDSSGLTYSGTGKITWANGDVFEGTLINGRRNGVGQSVLANGQRYNGDWLNDLQTGRASVKFPDGNHYEGPVVNGRPHGQGRMLYASGDSYSGQFNAGVKEGRGIYIWKNGQKFDGEWKNQSPAGMGRMEFASGAIYEGQFSDGEPNGKGTFKWPGGDQYTGEWKTGKKHGQGSFTWKSGDRWDGVYENDAQKTGELTRKAS
jgi:hypothetical protein